MGLQLEDGLNTGVAVEVFDDRLRRFSVQDSLMNQQSLENGTVFECSTTQSTSFSGVVNGSLFLLQNNDPSRNMVIDRLSLMSAAATGTIGSTYFSVGFGRTLASGGANVTVINENQGVVVSKPFLAKLNPFVVGTFVEAMRWYPPTTPDLMFPFDIIPQGSDGIILSFNRSIELTATDVDPNFPQIVVYTRFALIPNEQMG